jgi:hypothetical protein
MPERPLLRVTETAIDDIASYHLDAEAAFLGYFNHLSATFTVRFFGYSNSDVRAELESRLEETDLRSALAVLARLEAIFRTDYEQRCRKRRKDKISRDFRALYKARRTGVGLETEILEIWCQYASASSALIGELRGAFKFGHWLSARSALDTKARAQI